MDRQVVIRKDRREFRIKEIELDKLSPSFSIIKIQNDSKG